MPIPRRSLWFVVFCSILRMHPLDAAWDRYITWTEAIQHTDSDGAKVNINSSKQSVCSDVMKSKMLVVERQAQKHTAEKQAQIAEKTPVKDDPAQAVPDSPDSLADLDGLNKADHSGTDFNTEGYIQRVPNPEDAITLKEFADNISFDNAGKEESLYYAKTMNLRFSTIKVFEELLMHNEQRFKTHYFCSTGKGYLVPKRVAFKRGQRNKFERYTRSSAAEIGKGSEIATVQIIFHYTQTL